MPSDRDRVRDRSDRDRDRERERGRDRERERERDRERERERERGGRRRRRHSSEDDFERARGDGADRFDPLGKTGRRTGVWGTSRGAAFYYLSDDSDEDGGRRKPAAAPEAQALPAGEGIDAQLDEVASTATACAAVEAFKEYEAGVGAAQPEAARMRYQALMRKLCLYYSPDTQLEVLRFVRDREAAAAAEAEAGAAVPGPLDLVASKFLGKAAGNLAALSEAQGTTPRSLECAALIVEIAGNRPGNSLSVSEFLKMHRG